jgi:Flp pilus assembly protein TadD
MLGGDVPFKGTGIPSIMKKHLTAAPAPLASLGVSVPPTIEAVVRHALEKDADNRPQTVDDFISELRDAVAQTSASLNRTQMAGPGFQSETIISPPPPSISMRPQPVTTTMRIRTSPSKSRVSINNIEVGTSDAHGQMVITDIQAGKHLIRIMHDGYAEWERQIECTGGTCDVDAQLQSLMATSMPQMGTDQYAGTISAANMDSSQQQSYAAMEAQRLRAQAAQLEEQARREEAERRERERREQEERDRIAREEVQREEEARIQRAQQEAKERAEAENRKKAEEERQRLEAESARRAEEERKRAEAEAQRRAEEQAARQKAEEEARLRAKEAEAARKQVEAEAAARRKAEEEAAMLRAQQEEARRLAEQEAARRAEEERERAQAEARRRAEEEESRRLAEEARRKAEEEQRRRAEEERARQEREQREREERERALAAERERIENERRELEEQQARALAVEQQTATATQATGITTIRDEDEESRAVAQEEALPMVVDSPSTIEDFPPAPPLPDASVLEADTKEKVLPVEAPPPSQGADPYQASIFGYTSGGPSFAVDTRPDEEPFDPEVTLVPGISLKPEQRRAAQIASEAAAEEAPVQESQTPEEAQTSYEQPQGEEAAADSQPVSEQQPSQPYSPMPVYKPAPDYASWTADAGTTQPINAPKGRRQIWIIGALVLSLLIAVGVASIVGVYLYRRFISAASTPAQQTAVDEDVSPVLATVPKGTITLSAPQGSEVFIDDERVGVAGANGQLTTETLAGLRNVRVTKSGSRPWTKDAKVDGGETLKLSARPQRELKSQGKADHERRSLVEKYLRSGNYYGAEVEYRELLQGNPNDASVHSGLAEALNAQQRYAEALVEYEAALRLQPDNVDTILSLGQIYEIKRRDADAEATISRAVELQPKNASAQALLAWVLLRRGKLDQASSAIEKALQIKADPEFLDTKAYILLARSQTEEALKIAQSNVEKSKDPAFKATHAIILHRAGQEEAALAAYRQLRQSSRDDEWGDLKRLLMFRGYSKPVLETLAKLITATN